MGSSGPGGTESEALQGWLLKFGEDSTRLRTSVETFVDWLSNGSPPWAAYREFMSGRMIAIDKQSGVRPVGVGKKWRLIFTKIILKVTGTEATTAGQDDPLCDGLKAGIDDAIHGVQALWDENLSTEEWGFILVDAKNAFNDINCTGMLWTVRHLWPSGSCFAFNCYRHWSLLVLRNGNGTASILHSREGVTRGDPLAMIAYRIIILPLRKNLKREIPDVTHPWYADNSGDLGTFARLETYFDSRTQQGPGQGYHPDPTKSVLIVRPDNIEAGKVFGARHGFRVCTGACYLGGYIVDNESKRYWLRKRTLMWEKNINTTRKTAGKYPQESYAAVVRAIQSEWIFLLHVTWYTGALFAVVEKIICENVLPRLFFGKTKTLYPVIGDLSMMTARKSGLGLLNPVTSAQENYLSSTRGSPQLTRAVT